MTWNPQYRSAWQAAKMGPEAFRLEMEKPGANPNVREMLSPNGVVGGDYIIHGLIMDMPDESLPAYLQVLVDTNANLEAPNWNNKRPLALAAFLKKKAAMIFLAQQKVVITEHVHTPALKALAQGIVTPENLAERLDLFCLLVETYNAPIDASTLQILIATSEVEILTYLMQRFISLQATKLTPELFAHAFDRYKRTTISGTADSIQRATDCLQLITNTIYTVSRNLASGLSGNRASMDKALQIFIDQQCSSKYHLLYASKKQIKPYLEEVILIPLYSHLQDRGLICSGLNVAETAEPNSNDLTFFKTSPTNRQLLQQLLSNLPANPPTYSSVKLLNR
jgi:hypothetical protein